MCVTILLLGSVATADEYDVRALKAGECVEQAGNFVQDAYIEATRECQKRVDTMTVVIKKAPARESEGFVDGVLWGAAGTLLLILLL